MRTVFVVLLLVLLGACSSDGEAPTSTASPTATSAPATPSGSATPADPDAIIESETCTQVRAGIDAFNANDFDETVARFEAAVPLAEADDDGSETAGLLVEAVRYYADLAPDDYAEAARTSADFERYKQITLGLCVSGLDEVPPGAASSDPGVEA